MRRRGIRLAGAALALTALSFQILPTAATVQPSYDTIRVAQDGEASLYQVSIDWSPLVLNLPDGGAWSFFTAQRRIPTEPGANPVLSNRQLYASRFDPATGTWGPASALPGEISFGPTGVVDASGRVHLVYTIRGSADETSFGTLVYITSNDSGGWTEPAVIVANERAGHQLSPDLAIDGDGGLHLAWQDQRGASEEGTPVPADPSNADVFQSDLNPDGTWSQPVQINVRPDDVTNSSRPQLVADGDRLIALWSVYSTEIGLETATELQWSSRSISDPNSWTEPQALFDRGTDNIGGRFLDMADDPAGGVALVYGRRTETENQLYLQRLEQGSDSWSEPSLIAAGNRGSYPRIAVDADGTIYVVYNLGSGLGVQVGGIAVRAGEAAGGAEEALSSGEEGAQGISSVSIDQLGRAWVMYFHQPPQQNPEEARVLRGALVSSEPVEVTGSTSATPVAEATPAG